ncbi:hypothetical protein [Aliiglaciecola sp. LCG003]|uniref:hypothetical protein n=1 Tax=Aliiglaciecola sp. LCG003 TaxID=3053655 RepID=UPI0025725E61|nr:hypothetical protein [Aliiglaciecola sp. LCG003]WJG11025.1 hypothetical protein QR722_08370 [Aliiglaciecola sp. LCG003]
MLNKTMMKVSATGFSILFMALSLSLVALAVYHFNQAFFAEEFISGVIKAINDLFIALATFELAIGILKEYKFEDDSNLFLSIRRTVTRFVSVVVIALVLEGLIMIIKYSQLDLAGNLYYPVAVVVSASLLLMSLAVFLHMTKHESLANNA